MISQLCERAKMIVTELHPQEPEDELVHLRLRNRTNEISVAPYKEFILIVVQNLVEEIPVSAPLAEGFYLRSCTDL